MGYFESFLDRKSQELSKEQKELWLKNSHFIEKQTKQYHSVYGLPLQDALNRTLEDLNENVQHKKTP